MARNRRSTRRIVLQGADQQALESVLRPSGDVREVLETGAFLGCELLPWGSNYTYVALLGRAGEPECLGIYKPRSGEAPLWDFPDGTLYQREVAAYRFGQILGWDPVPYTIVRKGPKGIGSLQLYVDPVEDDYHAMRDEAGDAFRRMALFDYLVNNADRKAIHCLKDHEGRIWGIDHGLTFHPQPKLRTVIWDYCDEAIPDDLLADLVRLRDDRAGRKRAEKELEALLEPVEIEMTFTRLERLVKLGKFPELRSYRQVPYGWW
jgi:hypothetical protein